MYRAPLRDLSLALDAAGFWPLSATAFPELDAETVQAVLSAAGRFAAERLAPLNQSGDREGARLDGEQVRLPTGFAEAYREFASQGWNSLSADPAYGGQGLPKALELAVFEMMHAANMAFALCPTLTQGAVEALANSGNERQKRLVLPKLVSGEWTGTMNLTEPEAGSDLALIRTSAHLCDGGFYRLKGQKIFITWGDHDATDNICHLVLARAAGAPPGTKGISLFLATKRDVGEDGTVGELNAVRPVGLEHKLGIHGSPTCVMMFDGARAELVGQLGEGLSNMFVMMNAARLQVAVQGVAIAERAFQQAIAYSQERRQGRSIWSDTYPAAIYDHPDVRRSLMLIKARIQAARGICFAAGIWADLAHRAASAPTRVMARKRQELLTPIAKAWATDLGVEAASQCLQVHGGMGFIEETGAAQHYRDARIAPIYEGTNGIQAIDLVMRKLRPDGGDTMLSLCAEMHEFAQSIRHVEGLQSVGARLAMGCDALALASQTLSRVDDEVALSAATPFLRLAGDVLGGWMLSRQALIARDSQDSWSRSKGAIARLYAESVLSLAPGAADGLLASSSDLRSIAAEAMS